MSPIYTWQPRGLQSEPWLVHLLLHGPGPVLHREVSWSDAKRPQLAQFLMKEQQQYCWSQVRGTDSQVHIGCTGAPSSRPACVRPEQAQTEEPTWNQGSKYHRGSEGGSKEEAYIHSSIFSILDTKYFYFTTSQREIWYFLHYIYLTATLQTFIQKHMKKGAQ